MTTTAEAETSDRRFTVQKVGANKWAVLDGAEPVDGFFKTKGLAQAEADASEVDAHDPAVPQNDDEMIARMNRGERLAAALKEGHAVSDWRAAGQTGERPETPVLDWMADPTTKPARKPAGERRTVRTVEQDAELDRVVTEARAAGASWWKVAEALNDAGVPTATGKPWRDTTAWQQGKRLGLVA
jgi:hypothetical protein